MRKARKVSGIVPAVSLVLAALVAGPVVAATPAQAAASDCVKVLENHGYPSSTARVKACAIGVKGTAAAREKCTIKLVQSAVREDLAAKVCDLAAT